MLKGRHREAEKHRLKLHSPEEAAIEILQVRRRMAIDIILHNSWWSIFAKPSYRKVSLLAMGTTAAIHFSGMLLVNNYGPIVCASHCERLLKHRLVRRNMQIYAALGFDTNLQIIYASAG